MIDDFESAVHAIMAATHCDRAKAELTARLNGWTPAAPDPAAERDANVLEKTEQAEIVKLFRRHGFTVRSTSQARRSKIAIGFPDLFVTHKSLPLGFFFETKRRVGSVVSDAQKDFGADCLRCGIRWYVGDRSVARQILAEFNVPEIK